MNRFARNVAVASVCLWVLAPLTEPARAQAPSGPAAARAYVDALMAKGGVPGMQVSVATGGRLVWSAGIGRADVELDVAMTPAHLLRVGSVSKTITALALGRLVDAGRIDLDAAARRYVPGIADPAGGSTLRQLGGHLSGLRNYKDGEFFSTRHFDAITDAVAVFAADPLIAPPGARFAYSSYNFTLLSAAMEAAAATPFLTLVDQLVLEPAGLRHTRPDLVSAVIPGRAGQYEKNRAGVVERAPFVDLSNKWAAGGFLASTEDLVRLGLAYLDDTILKPDTRRTLFTSQQTAAGVATKYGIGWRVAATAGGLAYVHHGGEASGGRSFLLIVPATRSVVAMTANLGGAPYGDKEALEVLAFFTGVLR